MNDKVGSIVLNDDKQVKIFDSELKDFVCHISLAFCEKEHYVQPAGLQIGFTICLLSVSHEVFI